VKGLPTCSVLFTVLYHCLLEGFLLGLFAVKTVVLLLFSLGVPIYGKTVPQSSLTEIKP
jgi:hypothetical protein